MTIAELDRIDHIIYGTPNLDGTVDDLERRLGIRATMGGRHPGEGTRNALYSLGPGRYLEIMGPDPDQPDPPGPRWVGIDDLTAPKMTAWAARTGGLGAFVEHAAKQGVELGNIRSGGRQRPDGSELRWMLTDPRRWIADGVVPFFIDWGDGGHPAESAVEGVRLVGFRIVHPEPAHVESILSCLGLRIPISAGKRPALVATLESPTGTVQLT